MKLSCAGIVPPFSGPEVRKPTSESDCRLVSRQTAYGHAVREGEVWPCHGMLSVMMRCGKCERMQTWALPKGSKDGHLGRLKCIGCGRKGMRLSLEEVTT